MCSVGMMPILFNHPSHSKIFRARTTDYQNLIELWERSVTATHGFLRREDILHYRPLILDYYFDSLKLYYFGSRTQITGFIGLKKGFIQMLFVDPAEMNRGIGKSLINYAIQEHRARTVDVNQQNTAALAFYSKMGFEVTGYAAVDSSGKPIPVLSMTWTGRHRP